MVEALKPEFVAPLVLLLCSDKCPGSGGIYAAGGGYFAKVAIVHGAGTFLPTDKALTAEDILGAWDQVADMKDAKEYANAAEAGMPAFQKIMGG